MSGKAGEALAGKTDLRRCSGRSLSHDPSNVQEVEVLEQGEQVPDPAEGSSRDTSSPPHEDSERPDSASEEELVPAAKASETSAHLTQLMESRSSLAGRSSSIWTMGNRISHWRLAHQRGYHLDQLTQDKSYRHRVRKHERDCKAAVPLPLLELMEEEVLAILTETLKDYRQHLGARHPLTHQMEQRMEQLRQELRARNTGSSGVGQTGSHLCMPNPMTPQGPLRTTPSPPISDLGTSLTHTSAPPHADPISLPNI
ncbi:cation channel sperm-associated auxiliary subunit zeta isoform X1 [Pelodiscus sinensis]|uniref:cation channel sperm-associated auxiliary subunit zeta isoform X1 n=1 Tax=Pelodiscus sinensis TaxID=13735 RepID=UPI003F6C4804